MGVVVIVTGYWWTCFGAYWLQRLVTGGRAVERSGSSDWLLVYVMWSVMFIATGYWWT